MNTLYKKLRIAILLMVAFSFSNALLANGNHPTKENLANTEISVESGMEVEPWMLNVSEWTAESNNADSVIEEQDIKIEDWMLSASDENWKLNNSAQEPEIEIEPWMTDLSQW